DVQVFFAEPHALVGLVGRDDLLDAVNQQAVADRAALMRADVEERMQLPPGAHDPDLPPVVLHHIAGALGHIAGTRYEKFDHYLSLIPRHDDLYDASPSAQLTNLARVMSRIQGPETPSRSPRITVIRARCRPT